MISPLAARLTHRYSTARVSKRLWRRSAAQQSRAALTGSPILLRLRKKWYRAPTLTN